MGAFDHQVAVVTGASGDIGRAIAVELAAQGADLGLIGRNAEALGAVVQAGSSSHRVYTYQVDLADDEEIQRVALSLKRDYGHVDILIHSAGLIALGDVKDASVKDLDRQFRINVRAPYALTQSLLPMLRPRSGQIVFINSSAAINAERRVGQYAATKHALKALANSLRQEVNPAGLRVLNVFLGRTATRMQKAVYEYEGRAYNPDILLQPDDVARVVISALGLAWTAEVTEIHVRPFIKSY